jgi:hypothetical protein
LSNPQALKAKRNSFVHRRRTANQEFLDVNNISNVAIDEFLIEPSLTDTTDPCCLQLESGAYPNLKVRVGQEPL